MKTNEVLISYLKDNNAQSALIFPEGLLINFLADVKADDYYNSLIPLYSESFGESAFINHIKQSKPEYVVFNSLSMKEYSYDKICDSYATHICQYVLDNYTQVKDVDDGFRYIVFKRHQ